MSVVHECPPEGKGLTPCCDQTPFTLPRTDRLTTLKRLVTCKPQYIPTPSRDLPEPTGLLDVDRQYREFREERVDVPRPLTPADQALETLALMAEHDLSLRRQDGLWIARGEWIVGDNRLSVAQAGRTIGDAVRSCVQRLKEKA